MNISVPCQRSSLCLSRDLYTLPRIWMPRTHMLYPTTKYVTLSALYARAPACIQRAGRVWGG